MRTNDSLSGGPLPEAMFPAQAREAFHEVLAKSDDPDALRMDGEAWPIFRLGFLKGIVAAATSYEKWADGIEEEVSGLRRRMDEIEDDNSPSSEE